MAVLDTPPQQPPSTTYVIQLFCPIDKKWGNLSPQNHSLIKKATYPKPVEAEGIMHDLQKAWGPTSLRVIDNNGAIFCQTKKALFLNQ